MRNKFTSIIAFLLSACMLITPASALDLSISGINTAVDKLSSVSDDKWEALMLALPIISTDRGVDSLIGMIKDYANGDRDGMFASYIEMALNYTDADTMLRMLDSIKCVPEKIRLEYIDIFDRKAEYETDGDKISAFKEFMSKVYSSVPKLKPLLEKFEITDAVLLNLLRAFNSVNGAPILKMSGGKYAVNTVSAELENSLEKVWSETTHEVEVEKAYSSFAELLNATMDETERESINPVFEEIGLLKESDSKNSGSSSGGSAGSSSVGGTGISLNGSAEITEIAALEGIETDGKIYSVKISGTAGRISFALAEQNMLLKKISGSEKVPVKLSVNKDGKIYAVLSGEGNYIVEKDVNVGFNDVSGWGKPYVDALYARKIINGKTDDRFMPDEKITREEFVKLIVEIFDLKDENAENTFGDVVDGAWYEKYVASAHKNGIISGISETEFGVGQYIKRQDMAKIINSVLLRYDIAGEAMSNGIADFDTISDYAKESVAKIKAFGIISGDENGNFNPNNFATRQEAAKMVYGLINTYIFNSAVSVIK